MTQLNIIVEPDIQTDQEKQPCTICGLIQDNICKKHSIEELVVVDYKIKSAQSLGFPSGETHVVKGWKIKHNRSIDIYICDNCHSKHISETKYFWRRCTIISGLLLVTLSVIFYLVDKNINVGLIIALYGIIFLTLLFFVISISTVFRKDSGTLGLDDKALSKYLGSFIYILPIQLDRPTVPGKVFYCDHDSWTKWVQSTSAIEAKTGWSFIEYQRNSALSSQTCTMEEGASYLKVKHLGLYLDNSEN